MPNYSIESIIKPHAFYESVIEDVVSLSKQFGKNDCILIIAGANNFVKGKYPSFKKLNSKLRHITHTNIVLTSVSPKLYERNKQFVFKYNRALQHYALKLDNYAYAKVSYLDLSAYKASEVFSRLVKVISVRKKLGDTNLVFIESRDSYVRSDKNSLPEQESQMISRSLSQGVESGCSNDRQGKFNLSGGGCLLEMYVQEKEAPSGDGTESHNRP